MKYDKYQLESDKKLLLFEYAFTDKYPDAWIYARGSNNVRTRLYRIGITNNLLEIKRDFEVFGLKDDQWHRFRKGIEYRAFLIKRKNS